MLSFSETLQLIKRGVGTRAPVSLGFITPAAVDVYDLPSCFPLDDPTNALPEELAMILLPEGLQMVIPASGATVYFMPNALMQRCWTEMPPGGNPGDCPLLVLETLMGSFSFEAEAPHHFSELVQRNVAQPQVLELEFGEGALGFDLAQNYVGPDLSAVVASVCDQNAIAGSLGPGSFLLAINGQPTTSMNFAQVGIHFCQIFAHICVLIFFLHVFDAD